MDYILSRRDLLDADKTIIEEHRKSRIEALSEYRKLEVGQVDELDRLRSPIRMADIFLEAMNRELHRFSDSPAEFAAYLRAITKRRPRA
jgi:hypothetical protein